MAGRQISPTTVGAILASVFVVLILGYLGFLYLGTSPDPVTATAHQYDTQVLSTELSTTNDKSVFLLTVPLQANSQTSGGIPYSPSEIGKSDITAAGE